MKNSKSFGRLWMIGWGVLTYHSSFVESTDKLCKLSSILIICYFWEHVILDLLIFLCLNANGVLFIRHPFIKNILKSIQKFNFLICHEQLNSMYVLFDRVSTQRIESILCEANLQLHSFLPLLRHFNPAEPVVEKSVIL